MGTPAKFWSGRLFGKSVKREASTGFVPTTELAARIVGKPIADASATREPLLPDPVEVDDFIDLEMPDEIDEAGNSARQAERFVPDRPFTTLTDKRGKTIRARIINMSSTGVAVEADFRIMPPETVAVVGSKPVTPGRAIRGGHVFVFIKPLDPARANKQVVL